MRIVYHICTIPWHARALTPVACVSTLVELCTLRPKRLNYSITTCLLWRYILGPRFPADVAKQLKFDFNFLILLWKVSLKIIELKCLSPNLIQVNNYEIVVNFFHISHNLTWYSVIVRKFTRIYPVCSTYELTKQFM